MSYNGQSFAVGDAMNYTPSLLASLALACLLPGSAHAGNLPATPLQMHGCSHQAGGTHDDGHADFVAAMVQAQVPGAQLLHGDAHGATLHCHGVLRSDEAQAVDAQTVFQAASLSKVVGAYIALRLVDAGLLDLDTPLWQYWPSPRLRDNPAAQAITARMVLSHTSGLPNWQVSPADPAIDHTPLQGLYAPGEAFVYSGEGFYLLQRTLEHLSGQRWEALAREQVFTVLDMPSSHFMASPQFAAHKAYGHHADGSLERERVFAWENTAWTLSTTASDYQHFVQRALFAGQGLQPATHAAMLAAASNAHDPRAQGPADARIQWGLGVGLQREGTRRLAWHWGDNPGFKALFALDIDSGQSLVLLTNSQNGPQAYRPLLQRFLGPGQYPALDWVDAQP